MNQMQPNLEDPSTVILLAHQIVAPYGLRAEFLGDVLSVGVGGDNRTHTRVICLIGPFPGHSDLAELSRQISNRTGINRVTWQIPLSLPS